MSEFDFTKSGWEYRKKAKEEAEADGQNSLTPTASHTSIPQSTGGAITERAKTDDKGSSSTRATKTVMCAAHLNLVQTPSRSLTVGECATMAYGRFVNDTERTTIGPMHSSCAAALQSSEAQWTRYGMDKPLQTVTDSHGTQRSGKDFEPESTRHGTIVASTTEGGQPWFKTYSYDDFPEDFQAMLQVVTSQGSPSL